MDCANLKKKKNTCAVSGDEWKELILRQRYNLNIMAAAVSVIEVWNRSPASESHTVT